MWNRLLLFLVAILAPKLIYSQTCGGSSDILFLIDDSDSTKRNNPSNPDTVIYAPGVMAFIQHFIDNSSLGEIRMSILAFSDTCRVISDFTSNSSDLVNALSTFTPEYQGTDPLTCMERAKTIFDTQGRLGVQKFIIFLTDGSSRNAANAAAAIQDSDIDVIAIGFGNAIPTSELLSYVKDPTHVFKLMSDSQLATLFNNITEIACTDLCALHSAIESDTGLYPYPGNCARFIHIYPSGCVTKDCAYTTLWNDDVKVCDFPVRSTCDPCRNQPDGRETAYHLFCNAFWVCQGGVSQPRCCGIGNKYVQGSGCTPAEPGECSNACG